MEKTQKYLNSFSTISLDEMDKVKLMDRQDTKFAFRVEQLSVLLEKLSPHYKVLEINTKRTQDYISTYFDTETFKFYLDHHNGRVNRHKVRLRKYVESNIHFLEVKRKNNQGRTRKRRIGITPEDFDRNLLTEEGKKFIADKMKSNPGKLINRFTGGYTRISLISNDMNERVTIDLGLFFKSEIKCKKLDNLVIAEVKQDRFSQKSEMIKLLRQLRIFETRFSKYCFGINLLYPYVKFNRFKSRILTINKITHAA